MKRLICVMIGMCLSIGLAVSLTGCTYVGAAAALMPPPTVQPQYTRFAGQSIAVIVWADRGVRTDWPTIQLDLSNALTNKLKAETGKKKVLEGATFPLSSQSIARFQEDHPETEFAPIESTAVKLGVSRLIYIEIDELGTRSDTSNELFRGTAKGGVKVIEVENGVASVAYEERDIAVAFPTRGPKEGELRGNDYKMYIGVIDTMAYRIQNRFVPYEDDSDYGRSR